MWETWVWFLGWEDLLEKGAATHFTILACRIPWTERPGWLQHSGSQRIGHNWAIFACSLSWLFFFLPLINTEKAMAPHSSTLAWKIPWMEEPGGLQSMGSLQVGHDWATSLSLFTFMRWKRKWQPTPEFLPGESQGQGSLVGCHLWGRTESDTTEATQQQQAWRWGRFENEGHVWVRPLLSAVQCLLNKIQQVTDTANTDNLQKLKSL